MKKKTNPNANGVIVCDSIIMSVKRKRPNFRKLEAVFIAIAGYASVIFAFLGMFDFNYSKGKLFLAATLFSAFYISMVLIARKALWVMLYSMGVFGFAAYKMSDKLADGFKFVYNVIYKASFKTDINYYKYVKPAREEDSVTVLFIFGVWLLAFIIYFFTIYRPNPILPLLATFPLIEVGLYNGIEIPLFWGIMVVAYWLALLGMSTIDVGEYSGGTSGFVRKDNLFFPKRQMKLKVTEKCGMIIIAAIILIAAGTAIVMQAIDYKRSDELNQKRKDISQAFDEFNVQDLPASLARLSSAFGFTSDKNNDRLGANDHISYNDSTDLIVSFERKSNAAVYLKDDVEAVYKNNDWSKLDAEIYDGAEIFNDFSDNGVFPQDFPSLFSKFCSDSSPSTIWITSKVDKKRNFCPYGVDNFGGLSYNRDMLVSSINNKEREFSYKYVPIDIDKVAAAFNSSHRSDYSIYQISGEKWMNKIRALCSKYKLIYNENYIAIQNENIPDGNYDFLTANGKILCADVLESQYRDFVYKNYLQLPDNKNMDEVRAAYSDILDAANGNNTAAQKVAILDKIRNRMGSECSYTLSPGKTPSNRDFVNYFLIENKKGYCIHYATAGVLLARMAGIPARYATGYVVVADDFNGAKADADGRLTIEVKDNRSHAWAEIYLDGYGWVPYEFTAGYTSRPVSTSKPHNQKPSGTTPASTRPTTTALGTTGAKGTQANASYTTAAGGGSNSTSSAVAVAASTDDKNFRFPTWLKIVLCSAAILGAGAAFVAVRRKTITGKRQTSFTTGAGPSRIGNMYEYAESLLGALELSNTDNNYASFAQKVENSIGGVYVSKGSFETFMKIALRSAFSNEQPAPDELRYCENLVKELSESLYKKSGFFRRIWLKLGNVLV